MLITISGPSGSGKSSVARNLAAKLGLRAVDVGQLFRAIAKKHGMDVVAFGKHAAAHPQIDRELDAQMLALARKKRGLVLQGRLSGLLAVRDGLDAVKIWIGATQDTRARRIAGRDGITIAAALREIRARDRDNRNRYLATYGLDVDDLSVYDIVIPTDNRSVEQVVMMLFKRLWPKKRKPPKRKRKRTTAPNRP